jgi:phage shock protein C
MERKKYPYSLKSADAKIAGVCSTLGAMVNIDPTFLRIGFVAAAIFISFQWTLIAYAVIGVYLAVQKKRSMVSGSKMTDFDRMGERDVQRPSVKAMREDLDVNDRRLMAIDHHLTTQNEELAREIEALRKEDK